MDKVIETRKCKNCEQEFDIVEWDTDFYKKFDVPFPTRCPECRTQRRQAQLNQMNLFKRKCDGTGEDIMTIYPPEYPGKVYSQKYWGSDNHDGTECGRDYDFNRPFFEQFDELRRATPQAALFTNFVQDENSEFTNCAGKNRNCYMIFDSDEDWDCLYSFGMNKSKSSMDCYRVQDVELCYELIDCKNCYNCYYSHKSDNCSDSIFLNNCIGCKNCIYCSNIKNKEYHIFNEPVPKERYKEIKESLGSYSNLMDKLEKFKEFRLHYPQRFMRGYQNENVIGDYLVNCKNAIQTFDSMNCWDTKYCTQAFIKARDMMDCEECGESEMLYESTNIAYNGYNLRFTVQGMQQCKNLTYCHYCMSSSDLFGCTSLKKKQYCILNKQYTEEEYKELVPKIIEHMKSTGEWGELFPLEIGLFAYNLSVAQERHPLTKEEALAKGYAWRDKDHKEYQKQTFQIPDDIKDVEKEITDELLACTDCERNYKIMPYELKLLRQLNLPIPRKCFYCRHDLRRNTRNQRTIYDRKCDKCEADIKTTYAPEQPEIVYCEKCYQESLS